MAIDPSLVVVVNVVLTSATLSQQGFGTPMGVFQVSTAIQPNRTTLYTSVQSMLDAGFAVDDSAVLWATAVKAQSPAPTSFVIGRRIPGTAQVDTVSITTAAADTWSVTINSQVFPFIATALDTITTIAQGLKDQIDLSSQPVETSAVLATAAATFATKTSDDAGPFDLSLSNGVAQPPTLIASIDAQGAETATVTTTPATSTAAAAPGGIAVISETLTFSVNGTPQVYTAQAPLPTTATEYALEISAQLLGVAGSVVGGVVVLTTDREGTSAAVSLTGFTGTLDADSGFTSDTAVAGTGNVADNTAVTATELAAIIDADWTGLAGLTAVATAGQFITATTDTSGITGSIGPVTGTIVTAGVITWPGGTVTGTDATVAGSFTVTASIAGETFLNGSIVVPGIGAGTFTNTTASAIAEDMATTLAAINTFDSASWYIFTIETRNDADITAANTFVLPIKKLFVAQTSDADARDGVSPNIIETIAALNNIRTTIMWHDDDREYLDGGVAGKLAAADLDAVNGAITLMGKQINGIPVDDLSEAQVINIAGDGENNSGFGGNVHVELASRGFTMFGKTTEGEFIDVLQAIDWTFFRVQTDVLTLIATTPTKVPYTNAGIGAIKNAVLGRLNIGVTNGIFTDDDPLFPRVESPTSAEVSTQDKGTRVLRNVVGFAKLAGAIHKVFIQVNVSV